MNYPTRSFAFRFVAVMLLFCFALAANSMPQGYPPSVDSFFQNPGFNDAQLSPNARNVAMLISAKGGRVKLAIMDVVTQQPQIVAAFEDADIGMFRWVNDKRLVFNLYDRQSAQGDTRFGQGLYAVDVDGSQFKTLVERTSGFGEEKKIRRALPWNTYFMAVDGSRDVDTIFVTQAEGGASGWLNLMRLNTRSGHLETFDRPGKTIKWVVDQTGTPRVAVTLEQDMQEVHYKDPLRGAWRKLRQFNAYLDSSGFDPIAFTPDGKLMVFAFNGNDKSAIYTYDLDKNSISKEPLLAIENYDAQGTYAISSKEGLLGYRYQSDAWSTMWLDTGMQKVQQTVDALLPGTINLISPGWKSETPFMVVKAFSDVQPNVFFLFNSETKKLTTLGTAYPQIKSSQMAHKEMLRYQARDGLEIPAYLTMPRGSNKKMLPMVVMVHGGPMVRGGSWLWEREAQFLASRGYAVLEPEFRGGKGFGDKHFRAGWKQWGLAMQDDVADGVKWAISQGIADPKRVCIAGGSYGGYATLMGLINDKDLFRCGIALYGPSDLSLVYKAAVWGDLSRSYIEYGMPHWMGDPQKDISQFAATSPLLQAARLTQPLLLAHGGADARVPIIHGYKLRDALKAYNSQLEWVEYPDEGHGWALTETRVDFWTRVEKFLARHIGQP